MLKYHWIENNNNECESIFKEMNQLSLSSEFGQSL